MTRMLVAFEPFSRKQYSKRAETFSDRVEKQNNRRNVKQRQNVPVIQVDRLDRDDRLPESIFDQILNEIAIYSADCQSGQRQWRGGILWMDGLQRACRREGWRLLGWICRLSRCWHTSWRRLTLSGDPTLHHHGANLATAVDKLVGREK